MPLDKTPTPTLEARARAVVKRIWTEALEYKPFEEYVDFPDTKLAVEFVSQALANAAREAREGWAQ